jgi:SRSO17 transposase
MGLEGLISSNERFSRYVEGLAGVIGHADRVNPLRDYCTGLMMPCDLGAACRRAAPAT